MVGTGSPERRRTIWILSHRRVGDLNQMLALSQALGWPTTVKRISFRLSKPAAIPFLATRLLDYATSDPIEPPWPDLVLCAEGRASAIARVIQKRSRGAVKTVCLGRPAGSTEPFDLVLTTPQYRLPAASNIVELSLPLTPGAAPAVKGDKAKPDEHRRPVIAVLVGGTSLPERLDRQAALGLASDLVNYAREAGGTLHFITSPRTEAGAAAALVEAVAAPHVVRLWRGEGDDAFRRLVAEADHVVVTSDSVSMVVDAFAAGKPVSVYRLPQRHTMKNRVVSWLYSKAQGGRGGSMLKAAAWMFDHGLIEVRPDRRLVFERLVAQDRLQWFGRASSWRTQGPAHVDETATAIARIEQLFAGDKHRHGA
jgi:uncharacterized protein